MEHGASQSEPYRPKAAGSYGPFPLVAELGLDAWKARQAAGSVAVLRRVAIVRADALLRESTPCPRSHDEPNSLMFQSRNPQGTFFRRSSVSRPRGRGRAVDFAIHQSSKRRQSNGTQGFWPCGNVVRPAAYCLCNLSSWTWGPATTSCICPMLHSSSGQRTRRILEPSGLGAVLFAG